MTADCYRLTPTISSNPTKRVEQPAAEEADIRPMAQRPLPCDQVLDTSSVADCASEFIRGPTGTSSAIGAAPAIRSLHNVYK